MLNHKWIFSFALLSLLSSSTPYAQPIGGDGLGQTIQIYTRFRSVIGKATWLLVVRDLDNDQSIPYLFDITAGDNFWLIFTYGHNYVIAASNLQISKYKVTSNTYGNYRLANFCHFESQGRVIRGESMSLTLEGNLSTNSDAYSCHMLKFPDYSFTVTKPASPT